MTGWNSKRVKVDRFPWQGKTGLRKPVQKQLQIRARWILLIAFAVWAVFGRFVSFVAAGESPAPDVLFLVVDDMNDWISLLDPGAPIRTPNLERLARR